MIDPEKLRAATKAAEDYLARRALTDPDFVRRRKRLFALAAGAQRAETNEDLAQSEGRQSDGEAATPNPSSPSHIPLMNKDTNRADR